MPKAEETMSTAATFLQQMCECQDELLSAIIPDLSCGAPKVGEAS